MKHLTATFLLFFCLSAPAYADHLQFESPWLREPPPVSKVAAAYATIHNRSNHDHYIKSVSSPAFGSIEMHKVITVNGAKRMVELTKAKIPAKGKFTMQRGGFHIMLFNPTRAIRAGDKIPLSFTLGNGKKFTVIFPVKTAQ